MLFPREIKISLIYLKVLSKKRVLKSILFIALNNYIVNILEMESAQFLQYNDIAIWIARMYPAFICRRQFNTTAEVI